MEQELENFFKCVNNHEWKSKDSGICPECYTNLYELKDVANMKQNHTFDSLLGDIRDLKTEYNLSSTDVIDAIQEELEI